MGLGLFRSAPGSAEMGRAEQAVNQLTRAYRGTRRRRKTVPKSKRCNSDKIKMLQSPCVVLASAVSGVFGNLERKGLINHDGVWLALP